MTKQGGGSVTLKPKIVVPVNGPGWKGGILYSKSAAAGPYKGTPFVLYGTFTQNQQGKRVFSEPGISWETLIPFNPNSGTFKTVQIITDGQVTVRHGRRHPRLRGILQHLH